MKKRAILILLALAVLVGATALAARPWGRGLDWQGFAERHDLDGDGIVTAEELPEGAPILDHLDMNDDGVITESDIAAKQLEMVGQRLIRMADADRDGEVGSTEWDALKEALDPDGNGAFTAEDVHALRPEKKGRDRGERGDRRGPKGPPSGDSESRGELIADLLDLDDDQQLTFNDLDLLFVDLDEQGDGIVDVRMPHRGRGHAQGKR